MSLTSTRSPSRPRTRAAAEAPILMRLPDLRLPSGLPQAEVAAAPRVEHPITSAEAPLATDSDPPVAPPTPVQATAPEPPTPALAPAPEPVESVQPQPNLYALVGGHVARYLERFKRVPAEPIVPNPPSPEPVVEQPVTATEAASTSKPQPDEQIRLADRRHKARERQRRLQVETPQRSWWSSHAPVIAVGFFAALVLTIYLARSNRYAQRMANQAAWEPEVPELKIEAGPPSVEVATKQAPAIASEAELDVAAPEAPPALDRSPPLLAAKPQVEPAPPPEETAAPADAAEVSAADYPATDPTAHRPGGRVPRTARSSEPAPNYPSTSAPNTWR